MRRTLLCAIPATLIAAVLLMTACGAAPRQSASKPAATPSTPTSTPMPTLPWQRVTLPAGVDQQNSGLAISPVDGHNLWVCAPASAGRFIVWATHDMANSWRQVGAISPPAAQDQPTYPCTLITSMSDTHTLVAVFSWGSGEAGTLHSMSYFSADGGVHWRQLLGEVQTQAVASAGPTVYAILGDTAGPTNKQPPPQLVVSADGMQSWRVIRPAGLARNDGFSSFWLNPASGELFAATYQNAFWRTENAGASWSQVSAPGGVQIGLGAWLASQQHWMFCGGSGGADQFVCSTDLGKTWRQLPTITYTIQCASCGKNGAPYSSTQQCAPNAILADGSLLAVCPTIGSDPDQKAFAAYRLAANASAWLNLGVVPGPFSSVSATGQVWILNAQAGTIAVATLPA